MTSAVAWADAVRWVRARSWVEWLAIGLGLAVFAYLGSDAALHSIRTVNPGRLLAHVPQEVTA